MTKVIQLYDEDNGTENTLMIFTCQRYYHNQIIIQKSEFENTYQFQMINYVGSAGSKYDWVFICLG